MAIDVTTLGAANSYTNKHSGGGGTSDYSDLTNKPAINDVTLSGNKSSEDLGLQDALTFDDTPTEDSENPVTSDGVYKALGGKLNTLSGTSSDIGKLIIVDSDGNTIAISNILISDLVTIEDLHSAINGIFIVADELPTASEDTLGEIYLIPNGGENPNVRDEYLTVRSGTEGAYTYAWEKIGTTDIDLSGYVPTSRTIADIDLEDDITASELREALNVENGAEANVQPDWGQSSTAADDFIKNKPNIPSKVSDLENDSGFEANVQANWNEDDTSSDAYIQNKPTDMDVLKRIHFGLDTPVAQNKCYKLFTVDGLRNSLYIHFNYSFKYAFENPVAGTAILRLEKGYPELIDRETSLLELISDSNTFTNNIDICTRYVEEDYNLEVYIHGGSLNGYEDINCDIISCSDSINMLVIPDQLEAAPQDYNPYTDNYIPIYSHRGQIDNKVDKVEGKGLSTNDYTTAEKNKLSGIASGAEVNVQTDWSQSDNTADDYLKNKPTLGTAAAKDVGSANGVAELDSSGKVPSSQLPSYVDDVIEGYYDLSTDRFYEEAAFTTVIPPEAGKSWVDVASNKSYRWTGSVYVRVDEGVQLGETASSAYRGDRGKTAYDHSQSAHARTDATKVEASSTNGNIKINGTDTNVYTHPGSGTNPHGTTASDVGLGNVGNFKAVSTVANQGLSDTEKANAVANIDALGRIQGPIYSFSGIGSYSIKHMVTIDCTNSDVYAGISTSIRLCMRSDRLWYRILNISSAGDGSDPLFEFSANIGIGSQSDPDFYVYKDNQRKLHVYVDGSNGHGVWQTVSIFAIESTAPVSIVDEGVQSIPEGALKAEVYHEYSDAEKQKVDGKLDKTGGTMTGALALSGRLYGSGDDEGLVVGYADNDWSSVVLGDSFLRRSAFSLNKDPSLAPYWRYNPDGNHNYDLFHPAKSGTIALTSDLLITPKNTNINTLEQLNDTSTYPKNGMSIHNTTIPNYYIGDVLADGYIISIPWSDGNTAMRQFFIDDNNNTTIYVRSCGGNGIFGTWKALAFSEEIPDTRGTKTVSGNPITVTDAEPMNAESVVVALEPKQDLHGYDAPWVGGAGKNKLLPPQTTTVVENLTFTPISNDGNVEGSIVSGTSSGRGYCPFILPIKNVDTIYYLTVFEMQTGAQVYIWDITANTDINYDGHTIIVPANHEASVGVIASSGFVFNDSELIIMASETQITTFAPYSNICPITGYSEVNVERVGKNWLDKGQTPLAAFINGVGEVVSSESDKALICKVTPSTRYTLSFSRSTISGYDDYQIAEFENAPTYGDYGHLIANRPSGDIVSNFETSQDTHYVVIKIANVNQTNYNATVDTAQLELGSTATTYEPYQGNTYTIDLDGTKYGGMLDVTEGGFIDDHGYATINYASLVDGLFRAQAPSDVNWSYPSCKCSCLEVLDTVDDLADNYGISYDDGYFYMNLPPECGTTESAVQTWLQNNPIDVVYVTRDVTEESTTPTDIPLLENTNNISTDGTNITLKYQPNNVIGECKQYTDEQIEKIPMPSGYKETIVWKYTGNEQAMPHGFPATTITIDNTTAPGFKLKKALRFYFRGYKMIIVPGQYPNYGLQSQDMLTAFMSSGDSYRVALCGSFVNNNATPARRFASVTYTKTGDDESLQVDFSDTVAQLSNPNDYIIPLYITTVDYELDSLVSLS